MVVNRTDLARVRLSNGYYSGMENPVDSAGIHPYNCRVMKYVRFLAAQFILLLSACMGVDPGASSGPVPSAAAANRPVRTATPWHPPTPLPSATPGPADSGWSTLQPGLERRSINLTNPNGELIETVQIVRLDPAYYSFNVAYEPLTPRALGEWATHLGAQVVMNGGYFSKEEERYYANGLLIVDGQPIGSSYGDFAGMLAVTPHGPELRWLAQQPYDPTEPLLAGLQSFPLLVKPGGQIGFTAEHEDHLMARRSAIGQDRRGRILLLVAPMGGFTLHQLSMFLVESDLELDIAMNLDGGPSSGILLAVPADEIYPAWYEEIPAYALLPLVISVYPR